MTRTFHSRLGCSTISFRHQALPQALATIAGLGFAEIDLGALPGVCDHVPYVLDEAAVADVAATVAASGLRVRSINGDIGDLNAALTSAEQDARARHLDMLVALAAATAARAVVLPCGALDHAPARTLDENLDRVADELVAAAHVAAAGRVELWTESLHLHRLCCDITRAQALTSRFGPEVGIVMDFSHIVASGADPVDFVGRFGPRIAHVHIRDAVPGNINLSVGNGAVDFARGLKALADAGYHGHFALELETRDITHDERPAAAVRAGHLISELI
jgi:sugar phosphate isomerase/epimerase